MARGLHEKNFSGDIPNALAEEVEKFIERHRDLKRKQLLAVALDLFMSLPEPTQAILAFTGRDDPSFQDVVRRVTADAVVKTEPDRAVPVGVLQIERKKRRVYQQMLKSITDSPDLPDPLKQKIQQDLKEALQQLSQQTRKIRQDTHAKDE